MAIIRRSPIGYKLIKENLSKGNNGFFRHQLYIIFFTFICYVAYHMSRKPISVVKSVLHRDNCTSFYARKGISRINSQCHWPPFDQKNWSHLLGSLEYAYLFSYALAMFVSGHIAERMNLRIFLSWGLLLSGTFTCAFGFGYVFDIHYFSFYLLVQIVAGFFQATGWPAVVTITGNWFGKGRRGLIMGVWNSHTSVGNMLGSVLAGIFVSSNWGYSFFVPGGLTIIVGLLVRYFMIPYPEDIGFKAPDEGTTDNTSDTSKLIPESEEVEHNRHDDEAISIWEALHIPGVVAYSFVLFFAKLVSYTFLYWLPNYLAVVGKGMSPRRAADMSTVFDAGGILGGIFAGLLSDHAGGNRAGTCAIMLAVAAPLLFIYQTIAVSQSLLSTVILFFCGSLVNGPYALITTAVSADLGSHPSLKARPSASKALATVTAIIDGTGSMGAAFGPLLTGLIVPTGWHNVFYMLITSDLLALLLCLLILRRNATATSTLNGASIFPCLSQNTLNYIARIVAPAIGFFAMVSWVMYVFLS